MPAEAPTERLSWSFHLSYLPDRTYLREVLGYAARGLSGTKEAIQEETGIPTGASSGKVVPHLLYAEAMGLVAGARAVKGIYAPTLTPLGAEVRRQDPGLDEPFTQWLAHLHLCRRHGGAQAWHLLFTDGFMRLGMRFSEADAERLQAQEGGGPKLGPAVEGMYREANSFSRARILTIEDPTWVREPAPLAAYWGAAHAYLVLTAWDARFPGELQLTTSAFERETSHFATCGWLPPHIHAALDLIAATGAFRIERQLDEAVMTRLGTPSDLLDRLYATLP
jgi:hypothetical protein